MKHWIKERYNPQSGTYYVLCGKITKKRAEAMEDTAYGSNTLHPFDTKEEYDTRIQDLKMAGETIYCEP